MKSMISPYGLYMFFLKSEIGAFLIVLGITFWNTSLFPGVFVVFLILFLVINNYILYNIRCPKCYQRINEADLQNYKAGRFFPSKECQKCGHNLTEKSIPLNR